MKITASTSLSVARVLPFSRSLLLPGFSAVLPRIMSNFNYPNAWRDENISDDYHGRKIFDNFRWLEDPDSDDCRRFVDAQNAVSTPFIEKCQYRQDLFDWVKEKWNYPRYGCPSKHGDHYYYSYNSGLQNQSVLYVQDSLDGEPRVFMDPNKLSEDGTVALDGRAYSENGAYLAYALSESGSDWVTIKFKKAPSGEDLLDTLKNVKFSSMAWTHDHKGLFYNSYPKHEGKSDGTETTANLYQKLFFHKLETDQSKDVLVVEFADKPEWRIGAEVSDCGKYLIISPNESCDPVNRLYYVNLEQLSPNGIEGKLTYTKVVDNFEAKYEYITNEGSVFTFMTNLNAPNYKLMNIDFTKPEMEHWTTLVEEDKNSVLKWAACVNKNKLILCYLEDVKNKIYVHDLATGRLIKNLPLDMGTIVDYSGTTKDKEIFYYFMSFLTPGIIYRCDMVDDYAEPKVFRQVEVKNFDFNQYETKQMFYTSKDGMRVPMFIVHRKGLQQDGTNPTLLYGYGGFNISITPTFSAARLVFLQHMKGVYAMPNIRGGGEYGETWHKGGSLQNKQNSFDDFQCAAEYLINNNYTCRDRLIINGASNGGLLVGACVNQRPDLFGCAIAEVGVMDMLRFHKFTIGHAWTSDFGCADKPEDFEWLIKYSPLHNIKEPTDVQYPAVLLMTADHDDRVVPLHSLKYIAELQRVVGKSSKQTNPLMIKVDTKAGHGFGKPTAKKIQEFTDKYCFIIEALGLTCLE